MRWQEIQERNLHQRSKYQAPWLRSPLDPPKRKEIPEFLIGNTDKLTEGARHPLEVHGSKNNKFCRWFYQNFTIFLTMNFLVFHQQKLDLTWKFEKWTGWIDGELHSLPNRPSIENQYRKLHWLSTQPSIQLRLVKQPIGFFSSLLKGQLPSL